MKEIKNKVQETKNLNHFILLWASQGISGLGSSMTSFALILWAYSQKETAMSTVSMSLFSYLPYVLISFVAGSLADRWKKKTIMLVCDSVAAIGSCSILILLLSGNLEIWHLYIVNIIIGFMNAFQSPASMVAVTILTPRKYYTNISGMQALSNSLISIATPALATTLMTFGGLHVILIVDLVTFLIAFLILAFFIPIPENMSGKVEVKEGFWKQSKAGIHYLRGKKAIWKLILFFSLVNLLASMAGNSLMPAMMLSRTDNNQKILGTISSFMGIGTMVGGIMATFFKFRGSKRKVIFLSCGISFLVCDLLWAVGNNVWIWAFAAFAGNLPLPFLNASMSSVMREKIPVEMQGRAFSTQATFQYFTIPLGYLLGGVLSDYLFEPFMQQRGALQQVFGYLVGTGKGSGMALLFLVTGVVGFAINILAMRDKTFLELDYEIE